jgi:hypothetical protein
VNSKLRRYGVTSDGRLVPNDKGIVMLSVDVESAFESLRQDSHREEDRKIRQLLYGDSAQ